MDDGTGVIQCVYLHSQPPHGKERAPDPNSILASLIKHEIPKSVFEIGETVRITGRVNRWKDYRQIYVTEMGKWLYNSPERHYNLS